MHELFVKVFFSIFDGVSTFGASYARNKHYKFYSILIKTKKESNQATGNSYRERKLSPETNGHPNVSFHISFRIRTLP